MLFSIITVCFNNREGVKRTRDTIVQQTCRDFEWLIIDGGSNDGTLHDLKEWEKEIAFVRSGPDSGIYDAMNKGIDAARGDYIIFMNAGDVFAEKDVLQKTKDAIAQNPDAEFLYGDSYEILPDKRIVLKRARHHSKWWWGMWTHHQAMIYERDAIGNLRYDLSHPTNADYKLSMQIIKKANHIVQLDFAVSLCDVPGFSARRPAYARKMQRRARRDVMGLNVIANYMVSSGQALSLFIRHKYPNLFARFRFSA